MYEYNKPWYVFGIIKKIYYSNNVGWILVFTNNKTKALIDCALEDFKSSSDRDAYTSAQNHIFIQTLIFDDDVTY